MSFDLAILSARESLTLESARAAYERACDDGTTDLKPDDRLAQVIAEITSEWPALDDLDGDAVDDSPWAASFDVSAAHVIVPITWSSADDVALTCLRAASKCGLYLYDPQADELHQPGARLPPEREKTGKRAFVQAVEAAITRELAGIGFRPRRDVYVYDLDSAHGASGWLSVARGSIDADGSHDVTVNVGVHYPSYSELWRKLVDYSPGPFAPAAVVHLCSLIPESERPAWSYADWEFSPAHDVDHTAREVGSAVATYGKPVVERLGDPAELVAFVEAHSVAGDEFKAPLALLVAGEGEGAAAYVRAVLEKLNAGERWFYVDLYENFASRLFAYVDEMQ